LDISGKATGQILATDGPDPQDDRQIALHFRLQQMPGYLVRRLDSRAAALYETHTGQSELTPRQFGVLLTVFQEGVLSQNELGLRLHLDRSTLGEMLQRMIDRKLIDRRTHQRDRRTSEIWLTPLGERALMERVRGALDAQVAFLGPLPEYLRPVFMKCLEILANADGPPDQVSE
jgi:DNA-binding MarR family transcriptional regulator